MEIQHSMSQGKRVLGFKMYKCSRGRPEIVPVLGGGVETPKLPAYRCSTSDFADDVGPVGLAP
jgi:hypothetical protein